MKSLVSGLLAVSMALWFTGCSQAPAGPVGLSGQEQLPGTARPEKQELSYEKNGEAVQTSAALHKGQGYSVYIMDRWQLEAEFDDRVYTETWEALDREDVELEICHLDQRTLEEAREWIIRQETDFLLEEDRDGSLRGTDYEQEDAMLVRFFGGQEGADCYALVMHYPIHRTDGWDSALLAMADTFQITQGPVSGS